MIFFCINYHLDSKSEIFDSIFVDLFLYKTHHIIILIDVLNIHCTYHNLIYNIGLDDKS